MLKRLLFGTILLAVVLVLVSAGSLQYFALKAIDDAMQAPMPLATVPGPGPASLAPPRPVVFVGNNWQGTITVIDAVDYSVRGIINGIPDKRERLAQIKASVIDRTVFYGIRQLVGEGHNQYVDDMYSSLDGRHLIVSRPSFADVIAIDIDSGQIAWRFEVAGLRADHMALSPDGKQVAVSASSGNTVHLLDVQTGEEFG
ncbi:MAG: WD40 repeat domain-containing protein, partial [Pseudomonadota bacterium]